MPAQNFDTLKPRITTAINKIIKKPGFPVDPKGYSLLNGFIVQPAQSKIGGSTGYALGGMSYVCVAIVGNSTGQMFYFAAGTLLGIDFSKE